MWCVNRKMNGTCPYENRKSNKHGFWWSLTIGATFIPTYKNKQIKKCKIPLLAIKLRRPSIRWQYCHDKGSAASGGWPGSAWEGGWSTLMFPFTLVYTCQVLTATQNAPVPSTQWLKHRGSNHQLAGRALRFTPVTLLAQGEGLQLFIVVVGVVFVGGQRRDAYYRNDPSKYGLNLSINRASNSILNYWVKHVGSNYTTHAQILFYSSALSQINYAKKSSPTKGIVLPAPYYLFWLCNTSYGCWKTSWVRLPDSKLPVKCLIFHSSYYNLHTIGSFQIPPFKRTFILSKFSCPRKFQPRKFGN